MFWSKKEVVNDTPVCSGCGCLVQKGVAQVIKTDGRGFYGEYVKRDYYCKKCQVPYERVMQGYLIPAVYLKEFVVDEKTGEPIGYTKMQPMQDVAKHEPTVAETKPTPTKPRRFFRARFNKYDARLDITKICGKCKQAKTPNQFYNDKSGKYGKCYHCKDCMKASNKEWLARKNFAKMQSKLQVTQNV